LCDGGEIRSSYERHLSYLYHTMIDDNSNVLVFNKSKSEEKVLNTAQSRLF
jgi:hypothetical protein